MSQIMGKKYKILTIIGGIIITAVLVGGLIFGPFNSILPDSLREKLGYDISLEGEIEVRLIVDFNGIHENVNVSIIFLENQSATAYSILLEANLTLDITQYPNGIYIMGIEGINQNNSYSWWYLADGADGGVAANKFDLRAHQSKVIEWIYKTTVV